MTGVGPLQTSAVKENNVTKLPLQVDRPWPQRPAGRLFRARAGQPYSVDESGRFPSEVIVSDCQLPMASQLMSQPATSTDNIGLSPA